MASRTYLIETLGCKANVYDSRRLAEALEAVGWRPAGPEDQPDACIVNTCTVTSVADRKCRQRIRQLGRKHSGARIFVTGCYATRDARELLAIGGVAGVYARDDWVGLLSSLAGVSEPDAHALVRGDFGIESFNGRARAFLKIQEGCDSFCTYCIVPHVRGAPRSRPLTEVRAEADRLAASGFGEIVLTGIHLGLYGRDVPGGPGLCDAIRAVAETEGVERVRLSSLEPNEVDGRLLEAMQHPAVCAHLHLPLQSGDAQVLRRMNRGYTPENFLAAVRLARERLDRPAVTTDIMVGFPGETQQAFANTMSLCGEAVFSRLHVFPFSPRVGTAAAGMRSEITYEDLTARSRQLRELGRELACAWAASFVGQQVRVLFERHTSEGRLTGYTDRYVPFVASGPYALVGEVRYMTAADARGPALLADAGNCRKSQG
jgi:threonylcarbamoyladenosine tRNA methylthiotransferase MtaB